MKNVIAIFDFWVWIIHPQRPFMRLPQWLFWACLNGDLDPVTFKAMDKKQQESIDIEAENQLGDIKMSSELFVLTPSGLLSKVTQPKT